MDWRKFNYALHRDLGYLCIGLTLIYAVSGVAVNHIRDWNPNYSIKKATVRIEPIPFRGIIPPDTIRSILKSLDEKESYENSFQPDPDSVWIFTEGRTIKIQLSTGEVEHERFERRPWLYPLNYLHLNHPKKGWTFVADLYGAALAFLAVTGLLMIPRGKRLRRRAIGLTAAGIAFPIVFLLLYY